MNRTSISTEYSVLSKEYQQAARGRIVRPLLFRSLAAMLAVLSLSAPIRAAEPAADGIAGAFAEAVATAEQRTVNIYGGAIGRSPGYGTGLVVSAGGDILTANGVYLAGQNLRVTLPGGKSPEATG